MFILFWLVLTRNRIRLLFLFRLLSAGLYSAFVEDVAGYIGKKRNVG